MQITLMAAVPCKRFDFQPRCEDGRGGWVFSQFGTDRYVADPANYGVKLGLAVFASPAVDGDYIESTELSARMNGQTIGTDLLRWKVPNKGGEKHGDLSIYEWVQDVDAPVERSGLVAISIAVKLKSQAEMLAVDGMAYVHVAIKDTTGALVGTEEYLDALENDSRVWSW